MNATLTFLKNEMRPRGRWMTPFNLISIPILLASAAILAWRFAFGLGTVSNVDQEFPWGLWKGLNVITGVAFAGGAYVLTFLVYVLRLEKYHVIVRATVLNGFLAYCFYAGALVLDLGQPWHILNPIVGNSFGLTSVLFLVAWHFMLYMMAQAVEFSPAVAEWLGARRLHRLLSGLTVGAVVFGITLSTLHQSALGALYLMAEPKVHPLWYSELIPVLFFVSSIFAGLAMVIVEGTVSRRVFADRVDDQHARAHDDLLHDLARMAGITMFVYLFLEAIKFVHGGKWAYLHGGWAAWYGLEILGFTALPMALLLLGSARRTRALVLWGAALTLAGIVLNRLNISVIAFKWYAPVHYVPSWMEVVVSAGVLCAQAWVFRWIVMRMPVFGFAPAWARQHETGPAAVRDREVWAPAAVAART
jgi:Ni/Fe-hydrogenase subunit HybB-like protein